MNAKRYIAAVLALILAATCISCGAGSARVSLESGVSAMTRGEYEKSGGYFGEEFAEKLAGYDLGGDKGEVYRALTSRFKLTYTGEDKLDGDTCRIPARVEFIDAGALSSYVSVEVSVSGTSAVKRISELAETGYLDENFITSRVCEIVARKTDGKWTVSVSQTENPVLYDAFGLSGFLRWLENQE